MSDHDTPLPDDQDGAGDPLIARLRAGLNALAADVDDTPPALSDVSAAPTPARPAARRWMFGAAAAAVVAIAVGAVLVTGGDDDGREVGPSDSTALETLDSATGVATSPTDPTESPASAAQRYRAVGMVLEDDSHGPQLCLGPIMDSYPPQCGGLDITNWSWNDVEHEPAQPNDPSLGEITAKWGEYVVVGTYDAEAQTFTLTGPARVAKGGDVQPAPLPIDLSTPCDEPGGGWPDVTEAELLTAAERINAANVADDGTPITDPAADEAAINRLGGVWISNDPLVLNVTVAAPLDSATEPNSDAEERIRVFYDGPLCVVSVEYPEADLRLIQDEITADFPDGFTSIGVEITRNKVIVELPAPDAELERRLGDRYGDAVQVVITGLVAVDDETGPGPTDPPGSASPTQPGSTGPPVVVPGVPHPTEYRAIGFVLEDDSHGPQLCFGSDDSYPPQCQGIDITNWNWNEVRYEGGMDAEEPTTARWGMYVVVGTYDREANTFALTSPARTAKDSDYSEEPERDFSTPCEAPEVGWPAATERELTDAARTVDPSPGEEGTAIVDGMGGTWLARDPFVLNVAVTGDVAAAEATIREVYDGPLCVVQVKYTSAELQELMVEIYRANEGVMTSASDDVVGNRVEVALLAPDPELEARLAEEYGDAVAVVEYALEPVDDAGVPGSASPTTGEPDDASVTTVPAVELPSPGGPDTPVTSPVLD